MVYYQSVWIGIERYLILHNTKSQLYHPLFYTFCGHPVRTQTSLRITAHVPIFNLREASREPVKIEKKSMVKFDLLNLFNSDNPTD